jgi:5-dehydro-2-deoxygluconokinase
VARAARDVGLLLAMPVERSGQRELVLEYPDFEARLAAFDVDYAKVLVRYNPDGDTDANRRQLGLLQEIEGRVPGNGRRLMVEVLVPPEPAQLALVDGDHARYDRELRPDLMIRTIREMQDAGILPGLWKLEGIDRRQDCHRVADQVRSADGLSRCLILGRGADQRAVIHWLRQASGVPGFAGFAVGRTIWWDPLRAWLDGRTSRDDAVQAVATSYLGAVDAYRGPAAGQEQAAGS